MIRCCCTLARRWLRRRKLHRQQGMHVLAIPLIAATILFILYYLRPFKFWPRTWF